MKIKIMIMSKIIIITIIRIGYRRNDLNLRNLSLIKGMIIGQIRKIIRYCFNTTIKYCDYYYSYYYNYCYCLHCSFVDRNA